MSKPVAPFIAVSTRPAWATTGIALMALAFATGACAQPAAPIAPTAPVQVDGAWVRATVAGQQGTGGFMRLTAREATQLVGVSSPAAGVAELHEMKLEGDVMKMRAITALDLPAGKPVELKPGGHHLMLLDLKQPLPKDSTVPVTLLFRNAKGVQSSLLLELPVSSRSPEPRASMPADTHKHKH